MTLRLKTLLIVTVTLLSLLITLYLSLSKIWLDGFAQVESQRTYKNVERVIEALDNELMELKSTASDWAAWDETYAFVENANQRYIQDNFGDATITNLRLNFMVFINKAGRITYTQGFDLQQQFAIPIPNSLRHYITTHLRLFEKPNLDNGNAGIVVLPEGFLLVASHPILKSDGTAPSRGTLIVARFLNTVEIQRLEKLTHVAIAVYPFSTPQLPSDFHLIKNQLIKAGSHSSNSSKPAIIIHPLSAERIAGYTLLKDIQGKPGLLLRLDTPRDIYQQGKQSLQYLVCSLFAVGVIFGLVILLLLEKWVLSPLPHFIITVRGIRASGDLSRRLLISGRDELSRLGSEINQLLATLQDSQLKLRQSQEKYQSVVDNVKEIIFQTDAKGRWTFLNPAWTELTGFAIEESLGKPYWIFIPCEEQAHYWQQFCQFVQGKITSDRYEIPCQTKEGTSRIVEVHWRCTFALDGSISGTAGTLNDITERKLAQTREQAKTQQLEQTLRELTQTQLQLIQVEKMSSLGQLVAGVAHEINNPISFVYGNINYASQYIKDLLDLIHCYQQHYPHPPADLQSKIEAIDLEFLVQDLPEVLDSMRVGAERICEIVQSLRNFSRLDQAEIKAVDLHEGLDSTLLILHHRLKAKGKESEIKIIKDYGQLPDVECYPGLINQVFMNLISNAIDALEEKRVINGSESSDHSPWIRICTELKDSGSPLQEAIVIRITDNGTGMSEAVRCRLFDPFFTTKPKGKGTGLGLSISYRIVVERHKGQLVVNSEVGRGTEFMIELPIRQSC